ncbi:MAG: helix-hairpin-helix domain-containing protein [Bacteroidales bacterium]|nr:helix-hairpin-helix domain-containing protein [Bacteroidales bacterium]
MEEGKKKGKSSLKGSFVTGAIALVFLIIGYEVALFVHRAAVTRIEANRDHPDTVYIVQRVPEKVSEDVPEGEVSSGASALFLAEEETSPTGNSTAVSRRNAPHSPGVEKVREQTRRVESFRFNPNTVSVEDLQRLGFSEKQAQAIENYRQKGGRFRRKADFAKSYVVADSVFARLEPYIDLPKLDINKADSTALLALPGIGPWYAGKIVSYRKELGGFSHPEQLLEIYRFDREKYDGLSDLITCSQPEPYPLWTLPEADLAHHPYISKEEAHGIVLYRTHQPQEAWTVEGLKKAGVLSQEHADKLSKCRLAVSQ